mgnify:CR=1 FL=1
MNTKEIKQLVNQTVTDYSEKKIGAGDVSKRITPLANDEVFNLLSQSDEADLAGLIDQLADMNWYLGQDTFNHHDLGNILNVIDKYYEKIKDQK